MTLLLISLSLIVIAVMEWLIWRKVSKRHKKKTKEDSFNEIANANKLEGYYKGVPWYSNPNCPPNTIFFLNENNIRRKPKVSFEITNRASKLLNKQIKAGKGITWTGTYGNEYPRNPTLTSTNKHKRIKYKV